MCRIKSLLDNMALNTLDRHSLLSVATEQPATNLCNLFVTIAMDVTSLLQLAAYATLPSDDAGDQRLAIPASLAAPAQSDIVYIDFIFLYRMFPLLQQP
jgi:hypothetical protein